MNVLLINPGIEPVPGYLLEFQARPEIHRQKGSAPALGPVDRGGHAPGVDFWDKKLSRRERGSPLLDKHLEWADYDYVFVSAMAIQRESVKRVVARCQEKGVRVVAGGPLFTACHR